MKETIVKIVLASMICFCIACNKEEQEKPEVPKFTWTQTDFTEKVVFPGGRWMYRPKLKVLDDILFVSHNKGIFSKNLSENDSRWELFALGDIGWPIIDFVKNGDKILAVSNTGSYKDSLLYLSVDNGKTFENFTSPDLFQGNYDWGWIGTDCNIAIQIAQHPVNKNIIALLTHYGVSISEDFGLSWKHVFERIPMGQDWHLGIHPLDGNTMFYTGENLSFTGVISKSSDGGNSWSNWDTMINGGGDDCVHSIAYNPTNPDILVHGAEGWIRKSTDRGKTWNTIELRHTGMYFYKVLFDNNNPKIVYATGGSGGSSMNGTVFHLYRSTDTGDSWHHVFEYDTNVAWGGVILDMVQYRNKLFLYSNACGVVELDFSRQ